MTSLSPFSLQDQKRSMRLAAREQRRAHIERKEQDALRIVEVFLREIALPEGSVIASYSAVADELDPAVLNDALRAQGYSIALPVIVGKKKPLVFRLHEPGDMLLANPLGIFEPASSAQGVEPDVLLVPLLAFDGKRNRLGYGGGYYDRTIKRIRAKKPLTTIGIAFSFQRAESIPVGANDVPLDKIVTETGVI
jgi:5-formyltetrahydrofolate cyclo-ligase